MSDDKPSELTGFPVLSRVDDDWPSAGGGPAEGEALGGLCWRSGSSRSETPAELSRARSSSFAANAPAAVVFNLSPFPSCLVVEVVPDTLPDRDGGAVASRDSLPYLDFGGSALTTSWTGQYQTQAPRYKNVDQYGQEPSSALSGRLAKLTIALQSEKLLVVGCEKGISFSDDAARC